MAVGSARHWPSVMAVLGLLAPAGTASGQDMMSMSLEELLSVEIGVASRVSVDPARQPASVTTISREQIRRSGARTLNELLMLQVPGFFLVEDQDDTIAAVRGLAPDNNSKILLLLDGRNMNSEWFWGPPDALLNGIDLEFIDRVEVIRGPGSVTLGQGALLGVINIVTRSGQASAGHELSVQSGEHGRRGLAWRWNWVGANDDRASLYVSDGRFEGRPIRNEGLSQQIEQGLSVFERNHHLKRSEYRNLLFRFDRGRWSVDGYRFQQLRDLYNWRRDREQVQQTLTGGQIQYAQALGSGELSIDGYHHVDDYELRSHGGTRPGASRTLIPGLVMGGHRETRSGLRAIWTSNAWREGHRIALGAESNQFRDGQANARGNNFIVNAQDEVLIRGYDALNQTNRWSLPGDTTIPSVFMEDFIALSERWEAFAAARWDSHPDWGSELSPRLGLLWAQSERSHWRTSLQRGYRGAVGVNYNGGFEGDGLLREDNFSAIEDNIYFAANGNRNLRPVEPETMTSLELAWTFEASERLRLSSVMFYNVVENVIGVGAFFIADDAARAEAIARRTQIGSDRIGDWGGVFYFQNNDGELHHRGLELEAEYRRDDIGLLLRGSQSWVQVAKADLGQFGPGNIYVTGTPDAPGSRSFPESVSRMQVDWRPLRFDGRLVLTYTHLYYRAWLPPAQPLAGGGTFSPELPGDHLGNIGVDWSPQRWPALSVGLQVKNLWNNDALYPATSVAGEGVGNQGVAATEARSSWLSLRYRF